MATIFEIIQDCVQEGLGLPRDPIATDIRDLALATVNTQGKVIWMSWPFDNEKIDEFTAPAADANGIITFDATVDVIRAVRALTPDSVVGARIWNQDDIGAAAQGGTLSSDRFSYLSDYGAFRRIKIDPAGEATSFKVLALRKWVPAIVSPSYTVGNPTATPTDYRVLEFPLDRAEPALREFVKDALRVWAGEKPQGKGGEFLEVARDRETQQQDRDRQASPRYPRFSELGDW